MPQLPGGRHVGVALGRWLDWAEHTATFSDAMTFFAQIPTAEALLPLVDLVYYRATDGAPAEEAPDAGEPYPAGLTVAQLDSPECDWSDEEKQAFRAWLASDRAQHWLQDGFSEIEGFLRKKPVPEILRGILDRDD